MAPTSSIIESPPFTGPEFHKEFQGYATLLSILDTVPGAQKRTLTQHNLVPNDPGQHERSFDSLQLVLTDHLARGPHHVAIAVTGYPSSGNDKPAITIASTEPAIAVPKPGCKPGCNCCYIPARDAQTKLQDSGFCPRMQLAHINKVDLEKRDIVPFTLDKMTSAAEASHRQLFDNSASTFPLATHAGYYFSLLRACYDAEELNKLSKPVWRLHEYVNLTGYAKTYSRLLLGIKKRNFFNVLTTPFEKHPALSARQTWIDPKTGRAVPDDEFEFHNLNKQQERCYQHILSANRPTLPTGDVQRLSWLPVFRGPSGRRTFHNVFGTLLLKVFYWHSLFTHVMNHRHHMDPTEWRTKCNEDIKKGLGASACYLAILNDFVTFFDKEIGQYLTWVADTLGISCAQDPQFCCPSDSPYLKGISKQERATVDAYDELDALEARSPSGPVGWMQVGRRWLQLISMHQTGVETIRAPLKRRLEKKPGGHFAKEMDMIFHAKVSLVSLPETKASTERWSIQDCIQACSKLEPRMKANLLTAAVYKLKNVLNLRPVKKSGFLRWIQSTSFTGSTYPATLLLALSALPHTFLSSTATLQDVKNLVSVCGVPLETLQSFSTASGPVSPIILSSRVPDAQMLRIASFLTASNMPFRASASMLGYKGNSVSAPLSLPAILPGHIAAQCLARVKDEVFARLTEVQIMVNQYLWAQVKMLEMIKEEKVVREGHLFDVDAASAVSQSCEQAQPGPSEKAARAAEVSAAVSAVESAVEPDAISGDVSDATSAQAQGQSSTQVLTRSRGPRQSPQLDEQHGTRLESEPCTDPGAEQDFGLESGLEAEPSAEPSADPVPVLLPTSGTSAQFPAQELAEFFEPVEQPQQAERAQQVEDDAKEAELRALLTAFLEKDDRNGNGGADAGGNGVEGPVVRKRRADEADAARETGAVGEGRKRVCVG